MSTLPLGDCLGEFFRRNSGFSPAAAGPRPRVVSGRPAYETGFSTTGGLTGRVALFGKGDLRIAILAVNFDPKYPDSKLVQAFDRVLDRYRFR